MLRGRWQDIYLVRAPNERLLDREHEYLSGHRECWTEEEFNQKLFRRYMLEENYDRPLQGGLLLRSRELKANYSQEPDGTGEMNSQNLYAYTHNYPRDELLRDAMNRSTLYSLYTFLIIMSV
jgi:hypothetical protein